MQTTSRNETHLIMPQTKLTARFKDYYQITDSTAVARQIIDNNTIIRLSQIKTTMISSDNTHHDYHDIIR